MNTVEALNHLGGRFADFALPMLVQSSLMITALFMLDLALRKRVRAVVRYALWMLVLVKLILPPSFASPTSLAYWLPEKKTFNAPPAPSPRFVVHHSAVKLDEPPILPSFPPPRPGLQSNAWLLLGWLATALVLSALLTRRSRLIAKSTRRAVPATVLPEELLDACRAQMKVNHRVRLKLSVDASSPAVCGLWRPVIFVPQSLADKLSVLQLRAVLIHELAHIKRGDVLVHYVQTLLQIFYWWHPLLWLANTHIRRVREQAVDEMVMVAMGGEAETYPATLLEIAKLAFRRPTLALGFIGIVESRSTLAQRIQRLLDRPTPKSAKLGFSGLAVVLLIGAALLPMARAERRAVVAPPEPAALSPSAAIEIEVKFISTTDASFENLALGLPTLVGANGHRVWVFSNEHRRVILEGLNQQPGVAVLCAPRITTRSGLEAHIETSGVQPFRHPQAQASASCRITPHVVGNQIELFVSAKLTESGEVSSAFAEDLEQKQQANNGSRQVFAINVHGHINYDAGTAQASVGDGGAIVLQNPVLNDADGRRILVVVSPRILRSSASVIAPNSDSGSGTAPSSALRQSRVENNVAPAPPTKSPKSQPADNVTRGEGRRDNQSFAPSTDQEIEIEAVKGTEIHYNSRTGVSVVTNDFVVRFRSAVLTARRAEINTRTGDVLLEGAVTLQRGNQMWHGERLRYNFIRREITETNGPVLSVLAPNANGSVESNPGILHPTMPRRPAELPVRREALPNPFATTNLAHTGPGRQAIRNKLHRIVLNEALFDGVPLPQVLQFLSEEAAKGDPDQEGINFLINPNVAASAAQITIDPNTGQSITLPSPEPLDMNSVVVRINPPLKNVRLADLLEAIIRVADKPIRYSIEEYAVIFSQKTPEAAQLETRAFRVDPNTFQQALESVGLFPPGINGVTSTNLTQTIQDTVRLFFTAAGIDVLPPNGVFYNGRTGVLLVRATTQELDVIQKAIETLNVAPQQITIEAKFMEMPTDAAQKLGLDLPPPNATTNTWTRVLTAAQMRTLLRAAEQREGVDILTVPKVTTLSGRQTQVQALEMKDIVSGTKTEALPVGPRIDVIPYVAADRCTIQLSAVPQVTEVLDAATATQFVPTAVIGAGDTQPGMPVTGQLPLPVIRTRAMAVASADVYDGQTLVLANPVVTEISHRSAGHSVTNTEDFGKRLLVFLTPTMIDPAGNPIHAPGNEPFPADRIPAQPSR